MQRICGSTVVEIGNVRNEGQMDVCSGCLYLNLRLSHRCEGLFTEGLMTKIIYVVTRRDSRV